MKRCWVSAGHGGILGPLRRRGIGWSTGALPQQPWPSIGKSFRSTFALHAVTRKRPSLIRSTFQEQGFYPTRSIHATVAVSSPAKNEEKEQSAQPSSSKDKRKKDESMLVWSQKMAPGLALSAGTAVAGFSMASVLSDALSIPLSGIPISIVMGMTLRNSGILGERAELSSFLKPGITLATKTILQGGIVCVAAKLSLVQVWHATATSLPVVIASVSAGMLYLPWASRMAGLSPTLGKLLAAGTSICGVTAISALAPAVNAQNRDIGIAVANTVAFGTIGMLTYPYLFHALCSSPEQVGACLGVAIHDTSQVLGSALLYKETYNDEIALEMAAVTKLTRNLGLAVCLPVLTYWHHAEESTKETSSSNQQSENEKQTSMASKPTLSGLPTFSSNYVPPFLWAFLGVSLLRSGGDAAALGDLYFQVMDFVGNDMSKYALGTAMAGVGLSTSAASLRGVGWKPFVVGGSGALVVGGTGFAVASALVSG